METSSEVPWRHAWVVVVLVAVVLGTLHLGEQGHFAVPNGWAGLLAALAVVPLFWRDRRPELTVVASTVAVSAYFAASPGFPDGPIYLAVLLSTYALASRRQPREWLPYVGGSIVVIVVALWVRELRVDSDSTIGTTARLIWFAMVDGAAAALAVALRSRRDARAEQLRRSATEEQLRMAQDLHDGVGHGLAVIAMQAGVALHVLDRDPAAARRSLEAIRDTSTESLEALRAELARLSPSRSEEAPRRPRNGLADLDVLATRVGAGGVPVVLAVDPTLSGGDRLPADVDATAYAVVQEALTNVLRHAQASSAHVEVRTTDAGLEITVTDDGRVTPSTPTGGAGLGIPGMRSRVGALGGTLDAGPAREGGFRVHAVLPLDEGGRP